MFSRLALGLLLVVVLRTCVSVVSAGSDVPGDDTRREFVEPHMGTLFRIVLYAPPGADGPAAARAAFLRIGELDRLLSDYNPESEAMRLCRQPAGTALAVSADLFALLQRSQLLAASTDGAFDVTLGALTQLWRTSRRTGSLPVPEALAAARQASGHIHLRLDPARRTVTFLRPGLRLDFGGIAKGYAAEAALAVLARHGITQALVAASGDLALGEAPPGRSGWTVDLAPFGPTSGPSRRLVLAHVGISTSGDTEQSVTINGVRYSHLIDPATGLGLTRAAAVTVVTPSAALSDALATACSVLDPARLPALVAGRPEPVHVLLHQRQPDGTIEVATFGPPLPLSGLPPP